MSSAGDTKGGSSFGKVWDLQQYSKDLLIWWKRFLEFCTMYSLRATPCCEDTLLLFTAYLHKERLSVSSIRVYLASIRSLHINAGYGNPLHDVLHVHKELWALDVVSPPPKHKLPLTLDMLDQFLPHFYQLQPLKKCIWAAMTLASFGCLQGSKLTVSSQPAFDPSKDMTNADVQFSVDGDQSFISVLVQHSKMDKHNKGFNVIIGCSNHHNVCCYCAK